MGKLTLLACAGMLPKKDPTRTSKQTRSAAGSGIIRLANLVRQGTSESTITHIKTVVIQLLDWFDPNGTFMSEHVPRHLAFWPEVIASKGHWLCWGLAGCLNRFAQLWQSSPPFLNPFSTYFLSGSLE